MHSLLVCGSTLKPFHGLEHGMGLDYAFHGVGGPSRGAVRILNGGEPDVFALEPFYLAQGSMHR